MVDTIKGLGLLPVVVQKDVPGFVENRILYALLRECVDLVEKGVIDAEGLDTCVSWGIGYKLSVVGPMALLDMAGLDIYQAVGSYLNKELSTRGDVSGYVTERTTTGKLGMKTKGGIFNYTPERVVGMHWSNPPHIIPMIEVIAGNKTSKETVQWMVSTIKDLGLLPVVVQKDVPGFVENRVLYALLRECVDLVDQGVIDAEGLDTCVSWGIGYKLSVIGPMALLDMAGLDIYQAVGSYLNKDLCNRGDLSPYVTERTKAGKLGLKTGGGIFDYKPEQIAALRAERAKKLVAVRKALQGQAVQN